MITREELEKLCDTGIKPDKAYIKILDKVDLYNKNQHEYTDIEKYKQLGEIYKDTESYIKSNPRNARNIPMQEFQTMTQMEYLIISELSSTPIDKNMHFIWIGGSISDIAMSYIDEWKYVNSDYKIKLWYDSEALLVNYMKKIVVDKANEKAVAEYLVQYGESRFEHPDEFFKIRMDQIFKMKKDFESYYNSYQQNQPKPPLDTIIEYYLFDKFNITTAEVQAVLLANREKFNNEYAQDVRKNMDMFKEDKHLALYERELLLQWNLAAASDVLRVCALNKDGGIYLDVDFLPSIRESIFEGVQWPKSFDSKTLNRCKMQFLMKNKGYVKDYFNDTTPDLISKVSPEEVLKINSRLNNLSQRSDIYVPLGDIDISDISIKANITSNVREKRINNSSIAVHKDSMAIDLILKQIVRRYNILDEFINPLLEGANTYSDIKNNILEKLAGQYNQISFNQYEFLFNLVGYLEIGHVPGRTGTVLLTGPKVIVDTTRDLMKFRMEPDSLGGLDFLDFQVFGLSSESFNGQTEEEYRSQWLFDEEKGEQIFKEAMKRYAEGALGDIDAGINTNKNTIVSKQELLDLIKKITIKPGYENDSLHIIVQMQGDDISFEATKNLFAKYGDRAIIVQKFNGKAYFLSPDKTSIIEMETLSIPDNLKNFEKIKLTLIGHGAAEYQSENFAGLNLDGLSNDVSQVFTKILESNFKPNEIEIGMLGCNMFTSEEQVENTLPGKLLLQLLTKEVTNSLVGDKISVSANKYAVRINEKGRKELLTHSGEWISKEDVMVHDLAFKNTITYDKESNMLEVKAKDLNLLKDLRTDVNKILKDHTTSVSDKNLLLSDMNSIEALTMDSIKNQVDIINKDDVLNKVHETINNINTSEQLSRDLFDLVRKNNLSEDFIIIFDDITNVGNKYRIKFISETTGESRYIETENSKFKEYGEFLKGHLEEVKKGIYSNANGDLVHNVQHDFNAHVNTMSSAFFIQTVLSYVTSQDNISNLSTAVKIQVYTQIMSISLNLIQDATQIVEVVATGLEKSLVILPKLTQGLSAVAVILDGINLGAAIYELVNTKDHLRQQILSANVGIFAVNFTTTLSAIIASIIGATTVGGILGIIAVPIAGLAAGIPALVGNILVLQARARDVVEHFEHYAQVIEKGAFTKGPDDVALSCADGLPITNIDFTTGKYKTGSITMTGMSGGSAHVRNAWGYDSYVSGPGENSRVPRLSFSDTCFWNMPQNDINTCKIMILPNSPHIYYRYEHQYVVGSGSYGGKGVQLLNRMRDNCGGLFAWRFYATAEQCIYKLFPEYTGIDVNITLDESDRTFISPLIQTPQISSNMNYHFYSEFNANYTYVSQFIPLNVSISGSKDSKQSWYFNLDYLLHNTSIIDNNINKGNIITDVMKQLHINTKVVDGMFTGNISFRGQNIVVNISNKSHVYITFEIEIGCTVFLALDLEKRKVVDAMISGPVENVRNNFVGIINKFKDMDLNVDVNNIKYLYKDDNTSVEGYIMRSETFFSVCIKSENDIRFENFIGSQNVCSCSFNRNNLNDIKMVRKDDNYIFVGEMKISNNSADIDNIPFSILSKPGVSGFELMGITLNEQASHIFYTLIKQIGNSKSVVNPLLELIDFTKIFKSTTTVSVSDEVTITTRENGENIDYVLNNGKFIIYSGECYDKEYHTVYNFINLKGLELIVHQDIDPDRDGIYPNKMIFRNDKLKNVFDKVENAFDKVEDVVVMPTEHTQDINLIFDHTIGNNLPVPISIVNVKDKIIKTQVIHINHTIESFDWTNEGDDFIIYSKEKDQLDKPYISIRIINVLGKRANGNEIYLNFTGNIPISILEAINMLPIADSIYIEDGMYTIESKATGLYYAFNDDDGSNLKANGSLIYHMNNAIWTFKHVDNNKYTIQNVESEKYITLNENDYYSGTAVYQKYYTGDDTQMFYIYPLNDGIVLKSCYTGQYINQNTDNFYLVKTNYANKLYLSKVDKFIGDLSLHTAYSISFNKESTNCWKKVPGIQAAQYGGSVAGIGTYGKWMFEHIANGRYKIKNLEDSSFLGVQINHTNTQFFTSSDNDHTTFWLKFIDGKSVLYSEVTSKYLIAGPDQTVIQSTTHVGAGIYLQEVGILKDGTYCISINQDRNTLLTAFGDGNGNRIVQRGAPSITTQEWIFKNVEANFYEIINKATGNYLKLGNESIDNDVEIIQIKVASESDKLRSRFIVEKMQDVDNTYVIKCAFSKLSLLSKVNTLVQNSEQHTQFVLFTKTPEQQLIADGTYNMSIYDKVGAVTVKNISTHGELEYIVDSSSLFITQHFEFKHIENNEYTIYNRYRSSNWTVSSNFLVENTKIYNETANPPGIRERFKIVRYGEGYRIYSVVSGMELYESSGSIYQSLTSHMNIFKIKLLESITLENPNYTKSIYIPRTNKLLGASTHHGLYQFYNNMTAESMSTILEWGFIKQSNNQYVIKHYLSGKVMTAGSGNLYLENFGDKPTQYFSIHHYMDGYAFMNVAINGFIKCAPNGAGVEDIYIVPLVDETCKFMLSDIPAIRAGTYTISLGEDTPNCERVDCNNTQTKSELRISRKTTNATKFVIEPLKNIGANFYALKSVESGYFWDMYNSDQYNDTNVIQFTRTNNDNQSFELIPSSQSDPRRVFIKAKHSSKYLYPNWMGYTNIKQTDTLMHPFIMIRVGDA